ncbi:MAG: ABC transporter permease [Bdellovibrionales bacterium]|nr:ABC transporter permease [Bdellovibrionales bacterium]
MKTLRLIQLALKYHWDAHKSNPANLIAGVLGMVVNNIIVLWGLWAMLFDGKPDGQALTIYFLSLNAMITIAWGSICYFIGGVRSLGEYIEEGTLEPMLATPRNPLVLVGISQSITPALGDILQGLCNLVALFFLAPADMVFRCILFTFSSGVAFLGLFILTGSIPFFVRRGNALAQLLLECNLSLSFYPTGKIFTDKGRFLLFLTPAAVTGVLPMQAIENGHWSTAFIAVVGAMCFFGFSILIFNLGLKKYQTSSYVSARA